MTAERTIVVAIEDMSTAPIVAVEAAHVAMEEGADTLVFLHVLRQHAMMNAILGASGYGTAVMETSEEGQSVLGLAEQACRSEFTAREQPVPMIAYELDEGDAGMAIEHAVREHHADVVVLGARRPHAFGRLMHPCVRTHLSSHAHCRIHVAPLQETPAVLRA